MSDISKSGHTIGTMGPPSPLTPGFEGPSVQFKSKTMNFRALILYFFKKNFSLASLGINFIFISHSSHLTLLIISYIYFISSCTYFYIIYFVMYPHKCILKKFKKKYQEKWEDAYLIVKNARASRALRWALDPSQYYTVHIAPSLNFTSLHLQNLGKNVWTPPPPWPDLGSLLGTHQDHRRNPVGFW